MVYKTAFLILWKWIPHNERKPAIEITGRHHLFHFNKHVLRCRYFFIYKMFTFRSPDRGAKRKHFVNKKISTSENVFVEMHTNPDDRIPSFIFKQINCFIALNCKIRRCFHLFKNLKFLISCKLINACFCGRIRKGNLCCC